MDKETKIKFLKEFIKNKNLNKTKCAKELTVNLNTVCAWLNGTNNIPESIIQLIKYKII